MSRYCLSPRAQEDLSEIWDYSAERWRFDQADSYLHLLQRAIEAVAADPRKGTSCDEVRAGYRKYPAGSHMLLYRQSQDGIDIVRVLHGRWISSGTCEPR